LTTKCKRPTINQDPTQHRQRHLSEPGRDTSFASLGVPTTSGPAKGRGLGHVMRQARWAPVSNKETFIAGSVIRDDRASRRAGRLAIGLSAPPKNTRIRLNLASLSPMDASSPTCSAAVGRGGSLRLPRGRVASELERTPTAKRLFLWLLRTCVFSTVAGYRV